MPKKKQEQLLCVEALRHSEYYGMQEIFDNLYARSAAGEKFTDLMDLILSRENILLAYRNIKANNGSNTPGTDNLTIKDIGRLTPEDVVEKVRSIINGKWGYRPRPVRRKEIPKPNGSMRPLGIPCIWDRLIQQCIKQIMEPICEAKFSDNSYGFMLRYVAGSSEPIYPIGYVQHKNPMAKKRSVYPYSAEGRNGIHDNLRVNTALMWLMMKQPLNGRSVEYADNRISLFSAQWGKCAITGKEFISLDSIHCHHIAPKSKGGTDKYHNLVLVLLPVHKLIHATQESAIAYYLKILNLDEKQLVKVNEYREKAGYAKI